MNPILQALRDGGGTLTNDEIVDAVVTRMQWPDDVLERKQHGHNVSEAVYRIAWAKSSLKQAGYLTHSERGVWALTPTDKDTPKINERAIVTAMRKAYLARRTEPSLPPTSQSMQEEAVQETSAAEDVEEELSWTQQVLDAILALPPEAFERLSQCLLRESGFTPKVSVPGWSARRWPPNSPSGALQRTACASVGGASDRVGPCWWAPDKAGQASIAHRT